MVYEHYAKRCPDGFKHAAFGERLNAYIGMTKPSMRVPHKVGNKLFIDFTGKKLQIVDKQTGETTIALLLLRSITTRMFFLQEPISQRIRRW